MPSWHVSETVHVHLSPAHCTTHLTKLLTDTLSKECSFNRHKPTSGMQKLDKKCSTLVSSGGSLAHLVRKGGGFLQQRIQFVPVMAVRHVM